ncbi:MAG: glycine cleavage T C-terminal barrel domain-containing protein [Arthrobacter sp.]|uniref:glycine cleavage T C-terminal barrel domain-containing protein n=1 Tax=Arthrobacter sp. 179 TaxID=3457734 RepID=UPI002651D875|nr:glycine cleavage system protein T [Micrococcaceae bacterium]MDN5824395.1 glycine cleavage system protein T [Micrococcaceae bacterium]MDN5878920.1 glycine cleavage system protein T [Micrococcaceae bacterium]MDN5886339.1 glycine cleavage system protein T [Micrococcaceae bacterium]MDN5905127.1 glycine cleavage system protein T [Micrococcaceae bacterium]
MSETIDTGAFHSSTTGSLVNPHPAVTLYTRLRKSPYFWKSREHGVAAYSVYNHTYHPRHYGDPVSEYWSLLTDVTLWDVGVERQLEISGPDAFAFTNYLIPRDLHQCAVGQCKYVFITAADGGIINDPILLRVEEDRFWLSLADSDVHLWAMGLAHAGGWNVSVKEVDVAPIQIQGPKAKALMADLFGEDILDLGYYYLTRRMLGDLSVVVSRTGYTGETGYEIYLENASRDGGKLWDLVWDAGQAHDLRVIGPCHIRRIEAGMLAYGCDITLDTNPLEVGYDYNWMINLDQQADFVGKEALRGIRAAGAKRLMVGLRIDGPPMGSYNDGSMIEHFPVSEAGGDELGRVTSACFSPRLEANIGLAMVPIGLSAEGTTMVVHTPEGARQGTVVRKPFIDPTKETPKA